LGRRLSPGRPTSDLPGPCPWQARIAVRARRARPGRGGRRGPTWCPRVSKRCERAVPVAGLPSRVSSAWDRFGERAEQLGQALAAPDPPLRHPDKVRRPRSGSTGAVAIRRVTHWNQGEKLRRRSARRLRSQGLSPDGRAPMARRAYGTRPAPTPSPRPPRRAGEERGPLRQDGVVGDRNPARRAALSPHRRGAPGLDLSQPLGDDVVAGVRAALNQHHVIFFRDQEAGRERAGRFSPASSAWSPRDTR